MAKISLWLGWWKCARSNALFPFPARLRSLECTKGDCSLRLGRSCVVPEVISVVHWSIVPLCHWWNRGRTLSWGGAYGAFQSGLWICSRISLSWPLAIGKGDRSFPHSISVRRKGLCRLRASLQHRLPHHKLFQSLQVLRQSLGVQQEWAVHVLCDWWLQR